MRPFLILIAICFTSYSYAQIEKQVYAVLLKRDFREFVKMADGYREQKNNTTIEPGYNRDIVPGFQESIYYMKKSFPYKSVPYQLRPGVWVNYVVEEDDSVMALKKELYIYRKTRICIVRRADSILYFRMECEATSSKSFHAKDTTYEYRGADKMNTLNADFQKNIGMPLNEKELFIDTIYYGKECRITKANPPAQDTIYKWVANVNVAGLKSWLQSTNTEKQVYALQGLNSLASKGWSIPAEMRKVMQVILAKNGTMNYCVLCGGGYTDIKRLIAQAQLIYIWQKP